jgi:hypothetical protein
LSHGPGLFGRVPTGQGVRRFDVTGDLRGDTKPNTTTPHFRETDDPSAAVRLVAQAGFALADFGERPGEVAVPFHGVHGQVEMGVKNLHIGIVGDFSGVFWADDV